MIEEKKFKNATSLWAEITDIQTNSDPNNEIIWRGHSNAKWDLIPTVLRPQFVKKIAPELALAFDRSLTTRDQVEAEFTLLRIFVDRCDIAGTSIPNDSVEFRDSCLSDSSFFNRYISSPYNIVDWPGIELSEVIALAQLHGLPTRFLDWTANPYKAVYFAVSQALNKEKWSNQQEIAIFAFNKGPYRIRHCGDIRILHVGGSISKNVVNQQGVFTIHPVREKMKYTDKSNDPLIVKSLEKYLPSGQIIQKLTVPLTECVNLYNLCLKFDFSVAHLFPTADGASRQVMEDISAILHSKRITERK